MFFSYFFESTQHTYRSSKGRSWSNVILMLDQHANRAVSQIIGLMLEFVGLTLEGFGWQILAAAAWI